MNANRSGRPSFRKSPSRQEGPSLGSVAQNFIGNIPLRQRAHPPSIALNPDPSLMHGVREALSGTLAAADMAKVDSEFLLGFSPFTSDSSNARSFLCQQQPPSSAHVASAPMQSYSSVKQKVEDLVTPDAGLKARGFFTAMQESGLNLNAGQIGQMNAKHLCTSTNEVDESQRFLTFLDLMGKNADPPADLESDHGSYTGDTGGTGDFTNYFTDHSFVSEEAAALAAKTGNHNYALQSAETAYKYPTPFGQGISPTSSGFQQSLPLRVGENGQKGSKIRPSLSGRLVSSLHSGIDGSVFVSAGNGNLDELSGKYCQQFEDFKSDFQKNNGQTTELSLSHFEHSLPRQVDQDGRMLEVSTPVTDRSSPGCGSPVAFDGDENMFASLSIVGTDSAVIEMKAIGNGSSSLTADVLMDSGQSSLEMKANIVKHEIIFHAEDSPSGAMAVSKPSGSYSPLKETFESLSPDMQSKIRELKSKIKAMTRRKLRESLARDVKLYEVEPLMVVNRDDLAGFLGLGVTTWKSFVHSELGVPRWPARALKSISNKVLEHETRLRGAIEIRCSEDVQRLRVGLEKLDEERAKIMKDIRTEATRTREAASFAANTSLLGSASQIGGILGKRTSSSPSGSDSQKQQKRTRLNY